jgi:argonaute-like protein implicated in RNA metabolism and viral defense
MVNFYLVGKKLPQPPLRFSYSSIQAQHYNPRQGLRIYGPYDFQLLGKGDIRCVLIYPANLQPEKQTLVSGLTNGNGSFAGFKSLFRIPLQFVNERQVKNETLEDFEREIRITLRNDHPDIVIVLISSREQLIYTNVKSLLLGNGVPSQVVTAEKLRDRQGLPWTLENISLQIYAKIGGTPWTVKSSYRQKELVIGVSRAMDRQKKFVVGFITLFTHDGDYQFTYSLAPKPVDWENLDEYRRNLAYLIVDAYNEYQREVGKPASIIIHLCKRPGKYKEIYAVKKALEEIGEDVPYALLHLNDDTNYRLFDTSHPTYVPQSGIKVDIDERTSLLFLDGRPIDQTGYAIRRKRGVPRVLQVHMAKQSTLPVDEFPRLVEQIYGFARVNWRGFNAQTIPATLNYSYLVARLVKEIGAENWNHIASQGKLRDKAWFL